MTQKRRSAPFPALEPRLDDVARDDGLIHRLGKLALMEIAGDRSDASKVGLRRGKGDEIAEIVVTDQIGGGRGDDEVVIVLAEPARPRRRRQSDERDAGAILHPSEDLLVELMSLVDDDEIDFRPLPARERLD